MYDWQRLTPQELENQDKARKYGLSDVGGTAISTRNPRAYLDSPGLLFKDTGNWLGQETISPFASLQGKYWDMDGASVMKGRAQRYSRELAENSLRDYARKSGINYADLDDSIRQIATEYGDNAADAAIKAGKIAAPGAARKAGSVALQATGKGLNLLGAVEPVITAGIGMSQGLNPIEATGRAAAGTGAYALGSTIGSSIGGAIGTAIPIPGVGTAAGTLVGGILGGMTASWLADKTIDAAIGDDQEKIRLSQLQKRLAEGETGERQYSYNSIPTEQAIERQRSPYDYRAERYLPQPTQFAQPQQVQLRRWNEEGY